MQMASLQLLGTDFIREGLVVVGIQGFHFDGRFLLLQPFVLRHQVDFNVWIGKAEHILTEN